MTTIEALRAASRDIVTKLASGDYEAVVGQCVKSRLSDSDLREVICEYDRHLIEPPADAYGTLDALQIAHAPVPSWSVRVPLWTKEEGMSDLTLELTVVLDERGLQIELDDLHVL